MGRLIDADLLKDSMKKFAQEQLLSEYQCSIMVTDVLDDIDNQPTAFDVDKVVEQIEKLPHRKLNLGDAMMDIMESKKTDRHFICLEDVIAIVKGAIKDE